MGTYTSAAPVTYASAPVSYATSYAAAPVSFGTSSLAAPVTYSSAAPVTYSAGTYATTYAPPTYGASPYASYVTNFGTGPFVFTADPPAEESKEEDDAKDEDTK